MGRGGRKKPRGAASLHTGEYSRPGLWASQPAGLPLSCLAVWLPGCLAAWPHGSLAARLPGLL